MVFDQADNYIHALICDQVARNLEHSVRLPDARREAEKEFEFAAFRTRLFFLHAPQQKVGVRSLVDFAHGKPILSPRLRGVRGQVFESQIEQKDVHPGFAEDSEQPMLDVGLDESSDALFREAAQPSHSRRLIEGGGR
jgi:hypothetical protein